MSENHSDAGEAKQKSRSPIGTIILLLALCGVVIFVIQQLEPSQDSYTRQGSYGQTLYGQKMSNAELCALTSMRAEAALQRSVTARLGRHTRDDNRITCPITIAGEALRHTATIELMCEPRRLTDDSKCARVSWIYRSDGERIYPFNP